VQHLLLARTPNLFCNWMECGAIHFRSRCHALSSKSQRNSHKHGTIFSWKSL